MEPKLFCQSCSMPIDNPEDRGTEKDGTRSAEYCKYCYVDGQFTNPGITMEQMKNIITTQTAKMNVPAEVIQRSLAVLPQLKRWKK